MFIKKANIRLYAAALFSALIASSCLNLDETQDGAYGYLTISGIDVDINVSELVPTKSGSTVDITGVRNYSAPQLASASVKVTDSKGVEHEWTGEQLILPLGAYTVSATYGSNTFDAPYFVGTASGTISDNPSSATVKFTLANSVMKVTNTIPEHYTPAANNPVKISLVNDDSKNVSAPIDTYVFVPYDETLKIDVTGKSTAGVDKYFSCTMTSATEARKAYNVQITDGGASMHEVYLSDNQVAWGNMIVITTPATFKGISSANQSSVVYEAIPVPSEGVEADWSDAKSASGGVISGLTPDTSYYVRARVGGVPSSHVTLTPTVTGLSVSAAHTDTNGETEGGDLDGTDVQATFKSPHSKVTEAISEWSFVICKSTDENTALRTFNFAEGTVSGTVNSDGSDLAGANDWPYLPQGDYTLIATATMENGTKVSSKTPIKVPAPEFGVTVSAETSYSRYLARTSNMNDVGTGDKVMNISASVDISANLLKYDRYKELLKVTSFKYDNSDLNNTSSTVGILNAVDQEKQTWAKHILSAAFEFDGVKRSEALDCHVTGLPYAANPPTSSEWDEEKDVSFKNTYVRFGNGGNANGGNITLKNSFHVPDDINTKVKAKIEAYGAPINTTTYIDVSGNRIFECRSESGAFSYKTKTLEDEKDAKLSSTNKSIIAGSTYGLGYTNGKLYYINILYK